MAGGGKGGSQSTENTIPDYLEDPIRRNIGRAEQYSQIGFVPYMGPDVAAFTPMQQAAFQNTNNAAAAYGQMAPSGSGLPQATDYGGGVQGYSAFPLYQQALDELQRSRPGQFNALNAPFINPYTGAGGSISQSMQPAPAPQPQGPTRDETIMHWGP